MVQRVPGESEVVEERGARPGGEKVIRPPFKLVHNEAATRDTIACLKARLREAERGDLLGYGMVMMYKTREWDYETCGEGARNKTWSIGMLIALVVKLASDVIN